MKKFQIIRRIDDGTVIPSNWWGLCWYEDFDSVRVIAPIPLNLVMALARWCHSFLAYKWSQKILRGAQLSRRQNSLAIRRLLEIESQMLDQREITSTDLPSGGAELRTLWPADAGLIRYLLEVLRAEKRKAGL